MTWGAGTDHGRPAVTDDIDQDGDGLLDVVAPGKDGLYLFRGLGPAGSLLGA